MPEPEPAAEAPADPADPVSSEDAVYIAMVNEYKGLRRAGAGVLAAAAMAMVDLRFFQDPS